MTTNKVTVEIWSDIVCPFCFLGKKKIERAISELNAEDKVEIVWRSFQLAPDFPMDSSISTNEYLVERKGYPQDQVTQMTAQLVQQGKEYGLDFRFDIARSINTFNAHRLIHWANTKGKANELKEAFMINHFTKGVDLSVPNNLLTVVAEVGLDLTEAKQILASTAYKQEVERDIKLAEQLGITGVPFFIINGKATISGAQSDMVFKNELTAALSNLESSEKGNQGGICVPNEECK